MTQQKIEGKFYPLQHEEWLRACRELTPSQKDVLYYIRTIDPRNYGVEINAAEVARQLSSPERQVHRQTVSRALKELDSKGFIDLELLQVKAKVKPKGLWCDETPGCDETPRWIATHHGGSPHTTVDRDTPSAIATHHTQPEILVQQEFHIPKIYKSYLEFIRSLSEGERESFQEFCRQKTAHFNPPLANLDDYLRNKDRWQELQSEWKQTAVGRAATNNSVDWTQHPDWSKWLDFMRSRGVPTFVALGEWLDRKTRREIVDWADDRNLIWGAES